MTDPMIRVKKNGPYVVSGVSQLLDSSGNKMETKETFALCRCGASASKPFCDGTHSRNGFEAAEAAVPASKET